MNITPTWDGGAGKIPLSPYDALPRARVDALLKCDSYQRPQVLLMQMIRERDHRTGLLLFLTFWNDCDAPWPWRSAFAKELRYMLTKISLADVLPEAEREWFNSLPPLIDIYRGCERGRARGLSWTTKIDVALKFAQGRRCINRHPTLMTATIPKQHVFGVFLGRNESEVAVDYRRLRHLQAATEG